MSKPTYKELENRVKWLEKAEAEYKKAEDKIKEIEERYRSLFNTSNEALMIIDNDTMRFIDVNQATLELYGYSKKEFLKLSPKDISTEPDKTKIAIDKIRKKGKAEGIERFQKKKDGTVFPTEIYGSTFNLKNRKYIIGQIRDITKRKKAEEELKKSQSYLYKAQEIANIGSWAWESDSDEVTWSDQTFRMLGYAPNEIQMSFEWLLGIMHPDDVEPVTKGIEESMKTGKPYDMEYRLTRKDGKEITVHSKGEVVLNDRGESSGMMGIIQDITERKKAEESLRESEQKYRTLLETIPHGIQEIDLKGIMTFTNPSLDKMYGYEIGEQIGKPIFDYAVDETQRNTLPDYLEMIIMEQPKPTPYFARNYKKDGSIIYVVIDWDYKRDKSRKVTGLISIITDITERKKAEEALQKISKEQELILNSVPAALWYKDTDNRILSVNKAGFESVGMKPEDIIGKTVYELFPEEANYYFEDDLEVMKSGKPKLGIIEQLQISSEKKYGFKQIKFLLEMNKAI